jgi:hypothetical protein
MFSSTGHFVANIYMNNILPDLIDSSLLESLSDEGTFGRDRRSGYVSLFLRETNAVCR